MQYTLWKLIMFDTTHSGKKLCSLLRMLLGNHDMKELCCVLYSAASGKYKKGEMERETFFYFKMSTLIAGVAATDDDEFDRVLVSLSLSFLPFVAIFFLELKVQFFLSFKNPCYKLPSCAFLIMMSSHGFSL